ncbi:MAG: hypothetical protein IPM18_07280 [Phycisphaerales bacterium]|nr:hypothetical protein [Phycisphaerales bacterium]
MRITERVIHTLVVGLVLAVCSHWLCFTHGHADDGHGHLHLHIGFWHSHAHVPCPGSSTDWREQPLPCDQHACCVAYGGHTHVIFAPPPRESRRSTVGPQPAFGFALTLAASPTDGHCTALERPPRVAPHHDSCPLLRTIVLLI